jgi:hypothetical protein
VVLLRSCSTRVGRVGESMDCVRCLTCFRGLGLGVASTGRAGSSGTYARWDSVGDNCDDAATAGWVRLRLELAGVGGLARSEGVKGVGRCENNYKEA